MLLKKKKLIAAVLLGYAIQSVAAPQSVERTRDRPNILWFVVDDMSANFSCYGEKTIRTPSVDRLAKAGLRFTRAYATSPVCSTFRSAMITGMYQTSIGAQAPPRDISGSRLLYLHW